MHTAKLLDARRATTEGVRLLPSEVSRIRYEDLRAILLDYYREHKPRSITKRHTGETDSDGNKLTEEVFAGADKRDKFFKRMPITDYYGAQNQALCKVASEGRRC